jgi:hypothetical protein
MQRHGSPLASLFATALLAWAGGGVTAFAQSAPSSETASPPAAPAASSSDIAADVAFWNSVKDSRDPAELIAYLKAFPDGQFAVLARLRLDAARAQAGLAAGDLTEATIKDIQHRLYDLNYVIRAISGQLDADTTAAIRSWQRRNGLPETGRLDESQIATLRAQRPPGTWAALAFSGSVRETSILSASRKEAEARALAACFAKAGGGRECKVLAAGGSQCIAAAAFRTAQGGINTVAVQRGTLADAQLEALRSCGQDPQANGACEIVAKVCGTTAMPNAPASPQPSRPASPRKGDQDT